MDNKVTTSENSENPTVENQYGLSEVFKFIHACSATGMTFNNALKDDNQVKGFDEYTAIGFAGMAFSRIKWPLFAKQVGRDFTAEEKLEARAEFIAKYNMPDFPEFEAAFEEAVTLGFETIAFYETVKSRTSVILAYFQRNKRNTQETPQETPNS